MSTLPDILWTVISSRMIWAGHYGLVWKISDMHTGIWWGILKKRDHLHDLGVDGEGAVKMDVKERG
jgi:hypothetical protein